ncbi:hypothetical protein [Actinacidiphila alni]|uniref:WXG100 family type VII secretion target n=1 Tax=Actinacidiphila alni TaxID=380248 RepID=A0A1I2IV75_9ACTN|nr:hypothetical protein [Actinacidiphila alni]SFF46295.1 hypothetical protein SAMN05216251_11515 [Actinacidiphila alni]
MAEEPTLQEWLADLAALKDAIGVVKKEHTTISAHMASIDAKMKEVGDHWASPSHGSFESITAWYHRSQHDLEALLTDILHRMNTSYTNYHNAEHANHDNLTDGSSGG